MIQLAILTFQCPGVTRFTIPTRIYQQPQPQTVPHYARQDAASDPDLDPSRRRNDLKIHAPISYNFI